MIFDFTILFHDEKKPNQIITDMVFIADEVAPIEEKLKNIFQNKVSKNTEKPSFSVNLNLWNSYPENIDFSKGKELNRTSLSNEYKTLLYTNNITPEDFGLVSITNLFDFIIENTEKEEIQVSTFLKEILVEQ